VLATRSFAEHSRALLASGSDARSRTSRAVRVGAASHPPHPQTRTLTSRHRERQRRAAANVAQRPTPRSGYLERSEYQGDCPEGARGAGRPPETNLTTPESVRRGTPPKNNLTTSLRLGIERACARSKRRRSNKKERGPSAKDRVLDRPGEAPEACACTLRTESGRAGACSKAIGPRCPQTILNQDCMVCANIMSPESLSLPWKNAV
jgi:hypothetical protein